MKAVKCFLCIVFAIVLYRPTRSDAFELKLTREYCNEAIKYGNQHTGADIFNTTTLKQASFGTYPKAEGGLIMSKYNELAVVSSMLAIRGKTITPEKIKEIENALFLKILVIPTQDIQIPGDVNITLRQGTNNILPQQIRFGRKHNKEERKTVVGLFHCDTLDPDARTTIYVTIKNNRAKYTVDFSDIK
ncbi:MAG: hypothetical protein MRJ65_16360 [Candidatus Brocadiaceae bacterium]|nr:hypothetical protein [Candidatus Brocadiaceae bacterium]